MSIVRTKQKRGNKRIKGKGRKDKRRNYTRRNYTGRNYTGRNYKIKRSKRYTKKKYTRRGGGKGRRQKKNLGSMHAEYFMDLFLTEYRSLPLLTTNDRITSQNTQLTYNMFHALVGLREIEPSFTSENDPYMKNKEDSLLQALRGISARYRVGVNDNESDTFSPDVFEKFYPQQIRDVLNFCYTEPGGQSYLAGLNRSTEMNRENRYRYILTGGGGGFHEASQLLRGFGRVAGIGLARGANMLYSTRRTRNPINPRSSSIISDLTTEGHVKVIESQITKLTRRPRGQTLDPPNGPKAIFFFGSHKNFIRLLGLKDNEVHPKVIEKLRNQNIEDPSGIGIKNNSVLIFKRVNEKGQVGFTLRVINYDSQFADIHIDKNKYAYMGDNTLDTADFNLLDSLIRDEKCFKLIREIFPIYKNCDYVIFCRHGTALHTPLGGHPLLKSGIQDERVMTSLRNSRLLPNQMMKDGVIESQATKLFSQEVDIDINNSLFCCSDLLRTQQTGFIFRRKLIEEQLKRDNLAELNQPLEEQLKKYNKACKLFKQASRAKELMRTYAYLSGKLNNTKLFNEAFTEWIELPYPFRGKFKVMKGWRGRTFGKFEEKTLILDKEGKRTVDKFCKKKGYTKGYEVDETQGLNVMSKIPVLILIIILQNPEQYKDIDGKDVDIEQALKGAFPICMKPDEKTVMNVIVSRGDTPTKENKHSVQKFCLYYPDNSMYDDVTVWPLKDGFSLRTAIFEGLGVGRTLLNRIVDSGGVPDEVSRLGMRVDKASAYEDAIYWEFPKDLPPSDRLAKIQESINKLPDIFKEGGLSKSYDPVLADRNITVAQEEFDLFKDNKEPEFG